jgi:DNA polymerase-3 subunit delta'
MIKYTWFLLYIIKKRHVLNTLRIFGTMRFNDVIGQEKTKEQLRKSVLSGRIPHAQLFYGPEGSGTLPLAIAYAQYVACTNRSDKDACGVCPSCKKFEHLTHPDLHFTFPVNTSKSVKKDPVSDDFIALWRENLVKNPYFYSSQWYSVMGIENKQGLVSKNESEAIMQKINLKSFESEYKFLVFWLPEKMNATSANMLLKLIEEPPPKTLFLLVSEVPEQVLLTISSRTQPVKLSRISDSVLVDALIARKSLPIEEARSVARLASGNYISALEIIETSQEGAYNFEKFTTLMRLCYMRNIPEINIWVEEMAGMGREPLKSFFNYTLRLVRENFIMNLNNETIVYLTDKEKSFSHKFHPYINGRNILAITNEINAASADIERNANGKIVLFDMALKIVKLIRK